MTAINSTKRKYNLCIRLIILIIFFVFLGGVFGKESVFAKTYKLQQGENRHIVINCSDDEFNAIYVPYSHCYFTITITNISVEMNGSYYDEYVKYVKVDDVFDTGNDYYANNGVITFTKNGNAFSDDREFVLDLDDDADLPYNPLDEYIIHCDITVRPSSVPKLSKKSVNLYLDQHEGTTVTLKNASHSVNWSVSNKNVISISKEENQVYVSPQKIGTCYLTAKSGGKTFKCKVSVKGRKYLYAGGTLESYSTRSNIFTMKFKNCSDSTIKIKSSGAVAVDSDYTSYDRNLKLAKTVTVKPGEVKRLKFKVIGNYTWYDVNDFCINYTVTYKRKEYRMASSTETTWIKHGKKWKELLTYDTIDYY